MSKRYEELTLSDPFLFGKVMQDPENCQLFLSSLLEEKIEIVELPEREKFIQARKDGKFVRLDLYVLDNQERIYDAEMQNKSKNAERQRELPKRARAYQGMIDSDFMDTGKPYLELNECKIIFICNFDPFGYGRYCYTFQNYCKEESNLLLEDGSIKIFYNTKADLSEAPESVRCILEYIQSRKVTDEATSKLDRAVKSAINNTEWGREYMMTVVHDRDIRNEGREEGRIEGRLEGLDAGISQVIENMLRAHKPMEEIESLTGYTAERINRIAERMSS